ncbi:DUF6266 family protein [Halpernia sp.]|uniref:DUF6266 family protein n=1 Tax=Halpernia sp. TaxID=2782209 RepID=UPI003A91E0EC
MGTIKKGILGGFSGTVGTVVGANWRGIDIIRSRPKSSGGVPTALQMLQRKKFAMAIQFQNALRSMQSRLYGDNAGVKSRVNLAASYLLREVISEVNGEPVIVMDKVVITKGSLTGFQNLSVTEATGNLLNFTWEDNSNQVMAEITDLFCTAIYEEESGRFNVQEGPEQRNAISATVHLPEEWNGKTVHVFAFFQNSTQDVACNSVYLGTKVLI